MKLRSVLGALVAVGTMALMAVGVQAATYSAGSSEAVDGRASIPVIVTPDAGETTQVSGYIVKFTYDNTKVTPVLQGTDASEANLYAVAGADFSGTNSVLVADKTSDSTGNNETLAVAWASAAPVSVAETAEMAVVQFNVDDSVTENVPVAIEVVAVTNDGITNVDDAASLKGTDGEIIVATGTVYLYGDADQNGVVGTNDADLALKWVLEGTTLTELQVKILDVDGNGTVGTNDADLILQKVLIGDSFKFVVGDSFTYSGN